MNRPYSVFIRVGFLIAASITMAFNALAADPTSTCYTFDQCRGSSMVYVAPQNPASVPDSLTPVMINHVGRHGSRYPANSRHVDALLEVLSAADSAGTLTATGREMLSVASTVKRMSAGRWGALDSIGIAEQWGIAARMYAAYPTLFNGTRINAISSYSPRCIMSMYNFLHQITRLNNHVEISANSGREYSRLMRFFDSDADYSQYARGEAWRETYKAYCSTELPTAPLHRLLGDNFPYTTIDEAETTMALYSVLAGTAAMDYGQCDISRFATLDEWNRMWSCFNLRQYLLRSCSTLSAIPMDIASPLLSDLISTTDAAISDVTTGRQFAAVQLRFGHAETLMPLLALMRLDGCYYLTNYFDTVRMHWRDFDIVPMAANLQMVLFRSASGRFYVRVDLNEHPVPLVKGSDAIYIPWEEARAYLTRCIPLYYPD